MSEKHHEADCFGQIERTRTRCRKCEYFEACAYYAATTSSVDRRSKLISFEAIQEWLPDAADYDHIPGEPAPGSSRRSTLISMLANFFKFMLTLDDYTVGIICEVVSPGRNSAKTCTVSELGRLHGCSRQAMHRKILDIIARHPELGLLLKNTMFKLSRGRRNFIRKRAEEVATGA